MKRDFDADLWATHRCAETLAACERACRSGLSLAVADAVEICRLYHQPPPDWLAEAVASVAHVRT